MTRRRRHASAGFTLLEVLVALAILGTAVVAAIQGIASGLRLLKLAGDQQQAVLVADQRAREVITPTEGRESGTDGPYTWERTVKVVEAPDLSPAGSPAKWRVFEIDVTVKWEPRRQVEIATLRTVPATSDTTRAARPTGGSARPPR